MINSLIYVGYSLCVDETWGSQRSADGDSCLLECYAVLENHPLHGPCPLTCVTKPMK
jgi:hypothetical protein